MKKKLLTRTLSIVLGAAMLCTTAVPAKADTSVSANDTVAAGVETPEENQEVETEEKETELTSLNWQDASDEELSAAIKAAGEDEAARWLSEMSYEDYCKVLSRDTYLLSDVTVDVYETSGYEDEEIVLDAANSYTTDWYKWAFDCSDYEEPTADDGIENNKAKFNSAKGYYYVVFQLNGTETARHTIQISGLDTSQTLDTRQTPTVKIATSTTSNSVPGGAIEYNTEVTSLRCVSDWDKDGSDTKSILKMTGSINCFNGYLLNVTKDYTANTVFLLRNGTDTMNKTTELTSVNCYGTDYSGVSKAQTINYTSYVSLTENSTVGKKSDEGTVITAGKASSFILNFVPATYSVVYDGNGATGGATQTQTCSYGTEYTVHNNGYTKAYTASYVTNEGTVDLKAENTTANCSFMGWGNGTQVSYAPGAKFSNLTNVNGGAVTLTAVWGSASVTMPKPIKAGYKFEGWTTDEALAAQCNADSDLITSEVRDSLLKVDAPATLTADTTFYAVWSEQHNTVPYRVEYYKQKSAGSKEYVLAETVKGFGEVGDVIYASIKDYEGYVRPSTQASITLTNGENVVKYYYNLVSQSYVFDNQTYNIYIDENGFSYYIENGTKHYVYLTGNGYMLEYVISKSGTITITKGMAGVNAQGNLTISSTMTINGKTYKVTAIGAGAFEGNTAITTLTIQSGIKTIGARAFKNCTKLRTVTIGKDVTTIGKSAFQGCIALKKVVFKGSKVKTLGDSCFKSCKVLSNINLKKLTKLKKIPNYCFMNCKALKTVTIPKAVTTIGKKAFYNCTKLSTVTMKTSKLKKVGTAAFKKCKKDIIIKVPKEKLESYKKLLKGKY